MRKRGRSNSSHFQLAVCDVTEFILFFWRKKMVYSGNIDAETKAYAGILRQQSDLTVQEIVHLCGISRASVYPLLKHKHLRQEQTVTWEASSTNE